jgi:transcription elongation factor GreA
MQPERFTLTRDGYDALKRELEDLQRGYDEDQAEFADVNYSPDPSKEEAAYVDTKTTKERTEERIGHLQYVLERAEIVDGDPDPKRVDPGDRVTVYDMEARKTQWFDLLGSEEIMHGNREGISIESPVGKALLGHRVGDVIEVEVPDGKARYTIRKIEHLSQGDQAATR